MAEPDVSKKELLTIWQEALLNSPIQTSRLVAEKGQATKPIFSKVQFCTVTSPEIQSFSSG